MQLNQATDYAFRVVLHLAKLPSGAIVNGQTLADTENIPQRFLQKIMRSLTAAGLVKSHRGVDGGFSLVKPAGDITLLSVIEAMEGPVAIHRCLAERSSCTKFCTYECPVHAALYGIQGQFIKSLASVTFGALALEDKNRKAGGELKSDACKCSG